MIRKSQFLELIRTGNFKELFITELGWNRFRGQSDLPVICVDDIEYQIYTIAERNGFQILYCEVDEIPSQGLAKKIDTKLRRQAADYICIYRRRGTTHDLWCVPVRANEKRDIVMVEYDNAHTDFLYSKVEGFCFDIDEETNIVDLRTKIQTAFAINSEKITKDFYVGFKKQHKAFAEFVTGIDDHIAVKDNRNKQWFTSVMLNRLMFCYFIQKKGFLNLDYHYLSNRLKRVRQERGENRFFLTFYKGFLASLFHDGLNSPHHDKEFQDKYGKIPYLNGGMFEEHQLEREYAGIDIADEAFIRLFDFFDTWNWHLDTRITASGKDINPDVLGYIFEQYVNDRAQMGAYYTKEDITEYIGRNCILPFLFDKVAATSSAKDFSPDGFVWQTLRNSGDRYIFDAVKKGCKQFSDIPVEISRGIITGSMRHEYAEVPVGRHAADHTPLAALRSGWNSPTPEPWALPTEIWRETVDRLQRCQSILGKIERGEIISINDFITYNLDIRSFALDLIAGGDPKFIKHFYEALTSVTVLDPTCGSGAFLFAAMNILEPLYEACIERMQTMSLSDPDIFKKELEEIHGKYRSNIQYFIYKSIILRNLYGVDIMVEATEIAKLRLFLKMVAVVEVDRRDPNLGLDPLPDIDFNIRCGNTLVGYANKAELDRDLNDNQGSLDVMSANDKFREKIEEQEEIVASAYKLFVDVQLKQDEDMAAFKQAKNDLRTRLAALNDTLNHRLHQASNPTLSYEVWLKSHQPFNWLAEFYTIIQDNGGFDVIIGNPPYVTQKKSQLEALNLSPAVTKSCNLYSAIIYRCNCLISNHSFFGMIVPISYISTTDHKDVRNLVEKGRCAFYSSYDIRPAHLFEGAAQRLTIFIYSPNLPDILFSDKQIRWYSETRNNLFQLIVYTNVIDYKTGIYRSNYISKRIINIINALSPMELGMGSDIWMATTSNNFIKALDRQPRYSTNGIATEPSGWRTVNCESTNREFLIPIINSSLFYYIWKCSSDGFNVTKCFTESICKKLLFKNRRLGYYSNLLIHTLINNSETHVRNQKTTGKTEIQLFRVKPAKSIIDEIDTELARHYGFTEEELDFIINYDIKYRMGDELSDLF